MKLQEKREDLAYRMYPEPHGTIYYDSDLMDPQKVEQLFAYCQILEAIIFRKGWEMLIQHYGFQALFEMNKKSGWMDCGSLEEYILLIEAYLEDLDRKNSVE